jgi:tryptophanyl-tRNA synthetase
MTDDSHDGPAADRSTADDGSSPGADVASDGGTAAGADETTLDPWGSSTIADYRALFAEFGIEEFGDILPDVPEPHYLMRRGVVFGHREYDRVARALERDEPVAALSGFMPTGDPHVGHKLVFDELIWHQQRGADAYGLIADLEAHSARGLDWGEIDEHASDYLLSLLACGFDAEAGELYRQSQNRTVQDLAFELGVKANVSEMQAVYGFDGETDVSYMQSVVTQMADILYPQLEWPKPTVIPVGPDQDPHVRLARDLAARTRYFGVTEAYASFELNERERTVVSWLYSTLESATEEGHRIDADDADFGNFTCEQAALLIRDFRPQLSKSDIPTIKSTTVSPELLDEAGYDRSAGEWKLILEELFPVDAKPLHQAAKPTVDSLLEKLDSGGGEPLARRTLFVDKNANEAAFTALIEYIDGEKRVYDDHIDALGLDLAGESFRLAV